MKPTRDKSKHASHSKSTSQSKRSSASAKERGGHARHGSALADRHSKGPEGRVLPGEEAGAGEDRAGQRRR